jgi:staphylococcal nuclease domain-containing protein 1
VEDGAAAADADAAADAKTEAPSLPSVNETLVAEGLARVERTAKSAALREAQERARTARAGMWEYGDVDSDDDEPIPKPGAWGRRR